MPRNNMLKKFNPNRDWDRLLIAWSVGLVLLIGWGIWFFSDHETSFQNSLADTDRQNQVEIKKNLTALKQADTELQNREEALAKLQTGGIKVVDPSI